LGFFGFFTMQRHSRQAGGFSNDTLPAIANGFSLCGCPYPATTFVQYTRQALKFSTNFADDVLFIHENIMRSASQLVQLIF
jgi:hypothetical protein